jgi:hypothetical protein
VGVGTGTASHEVLRGPFCCRMLSSFVLSEVKMGFFEGDVRAQYSGEGWGEGEGLPLLPSLRPGGHI